MPVSTLVKLLILPMCGITGFFSFNQSFSRIDLEAMTNSVRHRGPDAEGFFLDEICGLGHRRLSILDLSEAANQPMFSHNGRYVCVYNGEIYNFLEIRKLLEEKGIFCKTNSDTEVLLEWFLIKGIDFIQDLNGIFTIAIYDKTEKKLFLFRDRMGIKPLYFYWNGTDFIFASELKALLKISKIPKDLNRQAISQFLHLGYIPAPNSIYQAIEKLPAASRAIISENELKIEIYWDINRKIKTKTLDNEQIATNELDKILRNSVHKQMISDVPLGVFLSGGIDSSTVSAFASQASGAKLKTFSIGFEEERFNEAPFAKAVANHLQTDHHELMINVKQAQDLIPQLSDVFDEPFADSSAIPTMLVSELARRQVTVALSGDGGDELFFGYGTYDWAKRLQNPLLTFFDKELIFLLGLSQKDSFRKGKNMFTSPEFGSVESHIFSQEQGFFSWKEINELLNPEESAENQQFNNSVIQQFTPSRNLTAAENQALFDLNHYLPDDLLVKVDRASMKYGLEVRVPLLDHELIEFALNLSPSLKSQKGIRKYLLKKVLYQYIPEKLFDRPKRGFAIPLAQWLLTDLKFLLDDFLNEALIKKAGIVKWESVKKLKDAFLKGDMFIYNKVWLLLVLHKFLDKNQKI